MNDDRKVAMLLDIDNYYGEHSGRLAPILKFFGIAGAPLLLWIYLGFPVKGAIVLPIWAIYAVRVALIVLGRESERLAQYKKIVSGEYADFDELIRVKHIHPDGCVEYTDGTIAYFVSATNGTSYDPTKRAQQIKEFIPLLGGDTAVDVYVQNITETKSLDSRYNNVKLFVDEEAAKDFVDMIDYNRQVVYSQSLLTRTVFVVKGRRADWTEVRDNCKMAVHSAPAKAFKEVCVAGPELVQDIMDTDVRGNVNLMSILQHKYSTNNYYGSKVLYFDEAAPVVEVTDDMEERGFMQSDG